MQNIKILALVLQKLSKNKKSHEPPWGHQDPRQELEKVGELIAKIDAKVSAMQNTIKVLQPEDMKRIAEEVIMESQRKKVEGRGQKPLLTQPTPNPSEEGNRRM